MHPRPRPRAARAAALLLLSSLVLTGCATGGTVGSGGTPATAHVPPAAAAPDYQLGGAYAPDPVVGIVARDRSEAPARGVYSICYVNAFQTQPGERADWPDELVLSEGGEDVIDPDWPDEALLDTRTESGRSAIAERVGAWIAGCADAGFDAVEFDNLDSYTRSGGALTLADNLALARSLVASAHRHGLAAAQKNAAEDAGRLREEAGFDFAVVEECAAYDECGTYRDAYGDGVIDIEYTDDLPRPFEQVCADPDTPASVVLRDRDLVTPEDDDYVFALCD